MKGKRERERDAEEVDLDVLVSIDDGWMVDTTYLEIARGIEISTQKSRLTT
jgi:hypothetical protein